MTQRVGMVTVVLGLLFLIAACPTSRAIGVWGIGAASPAVGGLLEPILIRDAAAGNERAVWALGRLKSMRAIPTLVAALRDGSDEVAMASTVALGQIGVPALPALRAALSHERNGCLLAAQALGMLGPAAEPAVPELIAAIDHPLPDARNYPCAPWAAATLGVIGPAARDAIPSLKRLEAGPDAYGQMTAREALGKIQGSK